MWTKYSVVWQRKEDSNNLTGVNCTKREGNNSSQRQCDLLMTKLAGIRNSVLNRGKWCEDTGGNVPVED